MRRLAETVTPLPLSVRIPSQNASWSRPRTLDGQVALTWTINSKLGTRGTRATARNRTQKTSTLSPVGRKVCRLCCPVVLSPAYFRVSALVSNFSKSSATSRYTSKQPAASRSARLHPPVVTPIVFSPALPAASAS